MGKLIDGKWVKSDLILNDSKGDFVRPARSFLSTIDNEDLSFKPESNRYHLYVSYACPWAHRCLIVLHLKGLTKHITYSVVHPYMGEYGWSFEKNFEGATGDHLYGLSYLYQLYLKADKDISTTVTVPVLWDKKKKTIVNNESSLIIRILDSKFNDFSENTISYYPDNKAKEIDKWNDKIYESINNGVYRCGFASTQKSYEEAFNKLFSALDDLDMHFSNNQYLVGDRVTEADIRLITTLLRFDLVYVNHFKCNLKRIIDYPNLFRYLSDMREMKAVSETFNKDHTKYHYYASHHKLNPTGIIPLGPEAL